jgi:hypothetical protein
MSRCPTCERRARRERREAKINGELEPGSPDRNGRMVNFTPEERQRRSALAKQLHAQGRLGGKANGALGGRAVKRQRITDSVLAFFREPEHQDLIIKAYTSNLKSKSKRDRLAAAEAILRAEKLEEERMRADRGGAVDPSSLTDEQLVELVAQGLEELMAGGTVIELGPDAVQDA